MIIIPTYNERKNIRLLVGRIRAQLPDTEILFVDDSSKDGTAEEIKSLQQKDQNIKIMSRPGKAGFASAYMDAFKFVLEKHNPEFIVTMDADLSHPPEKLPELVQIAKEGKVGIGSRYIEGGSVENWNIKRRILSKGANLLARFLTKLPIKDVTGGFMAIPSEKVRQLDLGKIKNHGYAFLAELKANLGAIGSEFVEIPITFEERKEGESKLAGSIVAEGARYLFKLFVNRQINHNYPAWMIFFISQIIYISTLPRTIFFGDSPEFMAAADTLGVAHPPGYPTYVLSAKLFTFLPVGSVEFRIGLFSAVCASLSLVIFYFLFRRFYANRFIGFAAALTLGFSSMFWSQAIMAKVYIPLTFFLLLIILLLVKYWETNKSGYVIASLFLFGLGAGLHQMILLFIPLVPLVLFVQIYKHGEVLKQRFRLTPIILGLVLFLVGLSVYGFVPLRSSTAGNFYDFSRVFFLDSPASSWESFSEYVKRTEYADYGGKFVWTDKVNFLSSALYGIWQQYYYLLVLVPFGLVYLLKQSKKFFAVTLFVFFLNLLGIILLRTSPYNTENDFLHSFYYLPASAMVAFWIAYGFGFIWNLFKAKNTRIATLASVIVFLIPFWFMQSNYKANNLSNFTFVDDYTVKILESLPSNAILLAHYSGANTDTLLFGFNYQQLAKNIRPDVTVYTIDGIHPEVDRGVINAVYGLSDSKSARYHLVNYALKIFPNRPLYTTFIVDDLSDKKTWSGVSNGLVYKFYPEPTTETTSTHKELDLEKDLAILKSNMFGEDLLAQYYYTQAAYWVGQKDLHNGQRNFIDAINVDYKVMGIDQSSFMFYRNRILGKQ